MDTKKIIQSFRQGGTGNCVSIAIIKAGIEVFGLDNIFHHITEDGIVKFTMRDGFESEVTQEEIQTAKVGSKFSVIADQQIFDNAVLCFAAMAKRAMIEGNDDQDNLNFQQAIETLNNGEYYLHGPNWLGLRHNFRYIGRKFAKNNPGCVGASKKHCFFVSNGWEDDYGTPNKMGLLARRFSHWYRLTQDQSF